MRKLVVLVLYLDGVHDDSEAGNCKIIGVPQVMVVQVTAVRRKIKIFFVVNMLLLSNTGIKKRLKSEEKSSDTPSINYCDLISAAETLNSNFLFSFIHIDHKLAHKKILVCHLSCYCDIFTMNDFGQIKPRG